MIILPVARAVEVFEHFICERWGGACPLAKAASAAQNECKMHTN